MDLYGWAFDAAAVVHWQKILDARGVKSEGIMEKSDLVALAEESWDLPLVELKAADTKSEPDKKKDEELDDMLRKLQQQTGAGFQASNKAFQINLQLIFVTVLHNVA